MAYNSAQTKIGKMKAEEEFIKTIYPVVYAKSSKEDLKSIYLMLKAYAQQNTLTHDKVIEVLKSELKIDGTKTFRWINENSMEKATITLCSLTVPGVSEEAYKELKHCVDYSHELNLTWLESPIEVKYLEEILRALQPKGEDWATSMEDAYCYLSEHNVFSGLSPRKQIDIQEALRIAARKPLPNPPKKEGGQG